VERRPSLDEEAREGEEEEEVPGEEEEEDQEVIPAVRIRALNDAPVRAESYRSLDSLPGWARATIAAHAKDERPHLYSLEELERSQTHDPLWNAAMGQLRRDGWFHNYLRMLWGKKIHEWSKDAAEALHAMEYLMGKYSLDGRDPISWSGYFWVLGRFDRAGVPSGRSSASSATCRLTTPRRSCR
jgi:hypothetical protein